MNDDNGIINDLISLFEIFNIYMLVLLIAGILLIIAVNTGLTRFSQKLMDKMPTRRFLILQISTLLSFALYIFGTIGLVVGVLQPPREFLIAVGGAVAVALGFALKDIVASLVAG
ncbi:mechanosensitive ion channel, partial [Alcanivorax sp. 1008]